MIITVSREFGSGGREIAKRLSQELGIKYYDKEIIASIAQDGDLSEGYVDSMLERDFTLHYQSTVARSFSFISPINPALTDLLVAQRNVLLEIGKKGEDCIIVGRSADSILHEFNPIRLFIYADMDTKLKRTIEREDNPKGTSEKEIIKSMRKIDKARANYYALFSELRWGSKENYDICINTTKMEIKKAVSSLSLYIKNFK